MDLKRLDRIIKLHSKRIQELQLQKTALLAQQRSITEKIATLEKERAQEAEFASGALLANLDYEVFFKALKSKKHLYMEQEAAINSNLEQLNEQIVEEHKEQKKYEILMEDVKAKELEKEKLREIKELDELTSHLAAVEE